jgi:hypothetical protein
MLAENGFGEQRIVRLGYYDRPLVIGRADRKAFYRLRSLCGGESQGEPS